MSGCCLSVFLSLFPLCVSVSPPFHLSVTFSFSSLPLIHLQLFILVSLSSVSLSVCPSPCQPHCLPACISLPACLSLYLPSCLPPFSTSIHLHVAPPTCLYSSTFSYHHCSLLATHLPFCLLSLRIFSPALQSTCSPPHLPSG